MIPIDPAYEKRRIISFIRRTFKKQKKQKAVIGLSGGIDSTTSYFLLCEALGNRNIISVHLPYFSLDPHINKFINKKGVYGIDQIVDSFKKTVQVYKSEKVRLGNIMARVRMIILYDLAKKNNALVCGTENKTEHLLGYYTRFGDEASDIEPIKHLFKTQVYELASYLGVPKAILEKAPAAELWTGQTDEGEFGFTYKEADEVLSLYFDKKKSLSKIAKLGFKNAKKIVDKAKSSSFKHAVPYAL